MRYVRARQVPFNVAFAYTRSNHIHGRTNVKKLRILIADDHELIRRGARVVLHSNRAGKSSARQVMAGRRWKRQLILSRRAVVDLGMPELEGIEAVRKIREAAPSSKVLVLTMHESDRMVQRALDAGAHGYILKSDLTQCLVKAVKVVSSGKPFLTPKVSKIMLEGSLNAERERQQMQRARARTTPRETEITASWQREKPTRRSRTVGHRGEDG